MEHEPTPGNSILPSNVTPRDPAAPAAPRPTPGRRAAGRAVAGLLGLALVGGVLLGRGAADGGITLPHVSAPRAALVAGSAADQAPAAVPRYAEAKQDSADPQVAAIQQVIRQADDEQARALAARDPSAMQDTATDAYYQQLVQTNQDLLTNDVTAIQLLDLEWGDVAITGDTATATAYETWTTTFANDATLQSRDRNEYTLVRQQGDWKIQSDDHPQAVAPAPSTSPQQPQPASPAAPDGQTGSLNWSGYAAQGGVFSAVSGTWTIPQPSATGTVGADAVWVGIGGLEGHDLIQAGTDEMVSAAGQVQDEAWIETLPQSAQPIPLAVHPGDAVTVSITQAGTDTWKVVLANATSRESYTQTVPYTSSMSSVEWVEEAPSGRRGLAPLADFGTVQFTGATAVKDGQAVTLTTADAQPITMTNAAGEPLAIPSAIGADGASFSVGRTTAAASSGPGQGRGDITSPRRHRIGA